MPYGGNPAAVLLLPYGLTLSDVTMKAIAAENNLSEVDPLPNYLITRASLSTLFASSLVVINEFYF